MPSPPPLLPLLISREHPEPRVRGRSSSASCLAHLKVPSTGMRVELSAGWINLAESAGTTAHANRHRAVGAPVIAADVTSGAGTLTRQIAP